MMGETQVMPFAEFATRLTKQLAKLACGISIYLGETETVCKKALDLITEVALDTCPQITLEMVRCTYYKVKLDGRCDTLDVAETLNLSSSTITRRVARLTQLDILTKVKQGFGQKLHFEVSSSLLTIIEKAGIFKEETPKKIKIR
jgi:hypothetical protein